MVFFLLSVLLLTLLLFFPVSKLIWVLSVRRMHRRLGRELNEGEVQGQLRRAQVIAVFLSLAFSYLFNLNLIGMPGHG